MIKRFGAIALAMASLPLTVAVAAAPASAQAAPPAGRPCGQGYTNGQPFQMNMSPKPAKGQGRSGETAVRVTQGAEVLLGSRLYLGETANGPKRPCGNERVGFYVRDAGVRNFSLLSTDDSTTDSTGLVNASKIAKKDFRFFGNYNINAVTPGVRSGATLVQTK